MFAKGLSSKKSSKSKRIYALKDGRPEQKPSVPRFYDAPDLKVTFHACMKTWPSAAGVTA